MKKLKTHNMNVMCKVVLTKYGLKIMNNSTNKDRLESRWYDKKTKTLTMELWDIMATFGAYLWMGNNDVPFEKNAITILEDT